MSSSRDDERRKRRKRSHEESYKERREEEDDRERNRKSSRYREDRSRSNRGREEKFQWGKQEIKSEKKDEDEKPKEKPNFNVTGKLAADTNTFNGVVIKYNEPPEARKPKVRWRLYGFKGDESLPTWYIHRQSAYLIGRDRRIADIPIDHPSSSKQHAVLQYRQVKETRDDGQEIKKIKPYVIDLESANGTFLNNKRIEAKRYYELLEKDVLKFGFSSREYVLMNEKSAAADDSGASADEQEKTPSDSG